MRRGRTVQYFGLGETPATARRPALRLLHAILSGTLLMLLVALLPAGAAWASGGEYTIPALPQGSFKVEFIAPEGANLLGPVFYNGKSLYSEGDLVSVTPPGTTTGIDAALATGGEVSGRVTAATGGGPLQGVEVCAGEREGHFGGCAPTNANGEYLITALGTGKYEVTFFPPEGSNLLFQYYSGKVSYEEADLVSVTAGATTPGVNAALAGGGQVAGTVTDALSKTPVANVFVCAEFVGGGPYEYLFNCSLTNASGEYTVPGLPSGEYTVAFHPPEGTNYVLQYYNNKAYSEGHDAVAVVAGETTTKIDAALKAGGKIAGTITGAVSKAPVSGFACAQPEPGFGFATCGNANGEGKYTLPGLETGKYKVFFGAPEGNYLGQYYNGKQSYLEADPVSVKVGEEQKGINAALASGGQITGRVVSAASGAPLANVVACTKGFGGCGVTNANGEYVIAGLSTDSYTVQFEALSEAGNYAPQLYNAKTLTEEPTPIAVTAGETRSGINAALTAGGEISGTVTAAAGGAPLGGALACASTITGAYFESCAHTNAPSATVGGGGGGSTETPGGGGKPAAQPNSSFSQLKAPRFNARTGNLEFFFTVANPGTFSWKLTFRNADVGFADALASAAKQKKCRHGLVRHKRRCVHATVPFGSGSKTVPAGPVVLKVHPSAKALKAIRAGRTLHVSGRFKFQSALGGTPVTHTEQAVVHVRRKHKTRH
jgi:hypothetical protein